MARRVLVSGAGIAGLAVAYWLDRHGFRVTVVERAPGPRHGGYKIDVRGAALGVLERMDLLEGARSRASGVRHASYVDARGRVVATLDGDLFGGRTTGDVELLRGALTELLLGSIEHRIELRFGDAITKLAAHDDRVDLAFEHAPAESFDLVVGADGLHSTVRAAAFGPEDGLVAPLGHYLAACTIPNSLGLECEEIVYAEPGRTVNLYHAGGMDQAVALVLFASAPLHYDRHDVPHQRRLLAEAFAGAGWRVGDVVRAMEAAEDLYFDSISQARLGRWSSGRVALVGDAAYGASPASGQATSMALVGAYVLAGELATRGDHAAAFDAYEAELRDYVARNQALAASNLRGMVLGSRRAVWAQTRMLGLLPRIPGGRRLVEPVVRAIHDAATSVTLRQYA